MSISNEAISKQTEEHAVKMWNKETKSLQGVKGRVDKFMVWKSIKVYDIFLHFY